MSAPDKSEAGPETGPEAGPETGPEAGRPVAPEPAAEVPVPLGGASDDPAADLPPVDSIGPETDIAPWLRPGIPAALKNAALRRKWLSTPAIRDYVDPALDYAWDWNAAAAVPGAAGRIGAEAVGKMLKCLTEPARPSAPDGADDQVRGIRAEGAAPAGDFADGAVARSPVQPEGAPKTTPGPSPEPSSAQASGLAALPVRRRHGGALPLPPAGGENKAD